MIKIYSTNCINCKVLIRQLSIRNIPHEVIETDGETIIEKTQMMMAPVLEMDGKFYSFLQSMTMISKNELQKGDTNGY